MKRLLLAFALLGAFALALFGWLTAPEALGDAERASLVEGDPAAGELVFWASGCGSCHAEKSARGEDKKKLGGGHALITPAGTFVTPNISPDPETGIGRWTLEEFAHAMWNGVSPEGRHYYPSFPYASYARMTGKDMSDLFAYLMTLEPVVRANEPHDLPLHFRLRRGIGLWKLAFLGDEPVLEIPEASDPILRGQYLVEGPAHCGECHAPRTLMGFGGMDTSRWLFGGPAPEGEGRIPDITPGSDIGGWSEADIVYYLESGFTPDFDSVGGTMVSVQDNMAQLPAADREAIAAYLKAIPASAD